MVAGETPQELQEEELRTLNDLVLRLAEGPAKEKPPRPVVWGEAPKRSPWEAEGVKEEPPLTAADPYAWTGGN